MKLRPVVLARPGLLAHALLIAVSLTAGLLTLGCGTGQAGSLGPVPADSRTSSSPASSPPSSPATASQSPGNRPSTAPASPTPRPTRQIVLQAWFTRSGKLFVTQRTIPATKGVASAAISSVLAGPSAAETSAAVRSQIPAGTALRGVRISGQIATVDLSSSFVSSASTSTMPLRIAQVVFTVTQFPLVKGVRFAINGQDVTVLGGVPVQSPQTRSMLGGYLPAITVQGPSIGEQVSSPVTISGTADVFEATVSVRLLDADGHEIARTFTTATCGTGCRGSYSASITYSVSKTQRGVIEVFESSAQNGQPIKVQQIPVILIA
jgi:hypothetical protein